MSPAAPRLLLRADGAGRASGWLDLRGPREVLQTRDLAVVDPLLDRAEEALSDGLWVAGFLAYEAAAALDPALQTAPAGPLPLLWLGLFGEPEWRPRLPSGGRCRLAPWRPTLGPAEHRSAVTAIRDSIAGGDTYQVNLTLRMRSRFSGDPLALFRRLWRWQRGPLSAYLDLGRHVLCSASPELLFSRDGERIVSRPMKGTAPRGPDEAADRLLASALASSEKERAENLMIVDMVRNDLGRIARPGSVSVPELYGVERYDSVHQMVSTVEAATDAGFGDVVRALFPAASITGAPRTSTMRHIRRLEGGPRGAYCGTIGWAAPGDRARFSVAIRTVWLDRETGRAEYGTGGGIVWDSEAAGEYQECLLKARLLTAPAPRFRLLETLLWRGAECGFVLLQRHLQRLSASARHFGFPDPERAVRRRLRAWAESSPPGPLRVRLLVDRRCRVTLQEGPLDTEPERPWLVALDDHAVDPEDRFLRHKTTCRRVYQAARRRWRDYDDVLLVNRDGEVTESTVANLVVEIEGDLLTPHAEAGLLPGTLRAELLAGGAVREERLRSQDLSLARAAWLINSVRGWISIAMPAVGLRPAEPPEAADETHDDDRRRETQEENPR